jgi:hypothetical protein
MMRASISTCGSGRSSVASSCVTVSSRAGRSVMIRVLVRGSICTLPRGDSTALLMSGAAWSALA